MFCRLIFAFGFVAIAAASQPARSEEPVDASGQMSATGQAAGLAAAPEAVEPSRAMLAAPASSEAAEPAEVKADAKPEAEQASEEHGAAAEPAQQPAAAIASQASENPAEKPEAENVAPQAPVAPAAAKSAEPSFKSLDLPAVSSAEAEALQKALPGLPAGGSDEERAERAALLSFYEARAYAPLWFDPPASPNVKASSAAAEIKRAGDWGLDPRDFALPALAQAETAPENVAAEEVKLSLAVLKYGRYARGGRIVNPTEQLSSYLDRRPQLLKPAAILDGIASAPQPDAYLRSLHPQHPQFEKLRQKYLALGARNRQQSAEGKRLLVNMEEWRWMPADMGDVYVWNNIPEYTQRVVTNGAVVRKERIVTGRLDKQTPIFSRPLRKITFKPTWIVTDTIKVQELWPNLMRGGSMMREWGLEVRKDGASVNWRKINWANTDIRTYEVIQPNGPKSVMGKVKFSFPSQHTVFMHDTLERDKWMFRASRRTYSHGCMRVANPINLAEILLREDKRWDAARVRQSLNTGGNNNEIPIDHRIMVHMTYFTALVDDDGRLQTFPDVYGHERRIALALEGKWNQIVKGRDHLAPVELDLSSTHSRQYADEDYEPPVYRRSTPYAPRGGFLNSLFSGGYGQ